MNISMVNTITGMNAVQHKIDQLADHLANVDSVGYKRKNPTFADVLNSRLQQPTGFRLDGRRTPLGLSLPHGTRIANHQTVWEQGAVKETDQPTDLMIQGNGVFELAADETGARRFTRGGAFQFMPVDEGARRLVTNEGIPVLDVDGNPIDLPEDAVSSFRIDEQGNVWTKPAEGAPEELVTTMRYVNVLNPQLLERSGANVYRIAEVDGAQPDDIVEDVDLNDTPLGKVKQGALELSNVDVGWTLSELMAAQRSYSLNARALASADTMNGIINNIRG